ncbi:acyl--CoA ligase [Dehalococcoidia bacterium]|nr:acyl--CoA ligase [Dehalococcoidia bacterium]
MTENSELYDLSTGESIVSLSHFSSPTDEYCAAFEDRADLFLNYYSFQEGEVKRRTLTRGEFWDLACSAAAHLGEQGISRGDRILHCFSSNSLYDLVFRLAAVFIGYVPVTINWQADDNQRILYKASVTDAKLMLYDDGFAGRVGEMKPGVPAMRFLEAEKVGECPATSRHAYPPLTYDDERMIIFTSGTTGRPKGVSLSHRSYLANRLTFEQYFGISETTQLDLLLVNPLHHANSSALSDWGTRRSGAIIHLPQRYATLYWQILVEIARRKRDLLVAPMVSRHIDFLETLAAESKLPVEEAELKEALSQTNILIGSAPVGPTTIKRILKFSDRLPNIRFGSTETCLQVMATPRSMSEDELMTAFEAGWSHRHKGESSVGYYIGREHFPFTRVQVVRAIDPEADGYLRPCEIGEPGYIVTQGANIMSYYVDDAEATEAVFREGWYTGLKDIVFTLKNRGDDETDYYWMFRDSELLIRGGANYAYDQIAAELSEFVRQHFQLKPEQFQLAVTSLRVESEHEDSCCVTIQLGEDAADVEAQLKADFIEKASEKVSKGARPDYLRIATIPRNFKGGVLYPQLRQDFRDSLKDAALHSLE